MWTLFLWKFLSQRIKSSGTSIIHSKMFFLPPVIIFSFDNIKECEVFGGSNVIPILAGSQGSISPWYLPMLAQDCNTENLLKLSKFMPKTVGGFPQKDYLELN